MVGTLSTITCTSTDALPSSDSGFTAPFHLKATVCRGHAGRRPAHPGGHAPQLRISLIGHWLGVGDRRQPFARPLVAFGLLRREKSEKRGLHWKRLTLKMRLPRGSHNWISVKAACRKFPNQELLFTVFSTRLSETDRSIGCLTDGGSRT